MGPGETGQANYVDGKQIAHVPRSMASKLVAQKQKQKNVTERKGKPGVADITGGHAKAQSWAERSNYANDNGQRSRVLVDAIKRFNRAACNDDIRSKSSSFSSPIQGVSWQMNRTNVNSLNIENEAKCSEAI